MLPLTAVFFRKYCTEQAQALGIRGWVMNTPRGTVVGELQGSADAMANMKAWLSTKGSPKSVIEKVVFTGERTISNYTFACFEFRR